MSVINFSIVDTYSSTVNCGETLFINLAKTHPRGPVCLVTLFPQLLDVIQDIPVYYHIIVGLQTKIDAPP